MNNQNQPSSNPDAQNSKTNPMTQSVDKGQVDKASHSGIQKEEPCSSREANTIERITPDADANRNGMLGEG